MAECDSSQGTVFYEPQKFCFHYAEKKFCKKKENCQFIHRKKTQIEISEIKEEEGYILGRCELIPVCRYFLRGYCTHAGNCRFRHELRPPTPQSLSTNNFPSTSTSENNLAQTNMNNNNNGNDEEAASTANDVNKENNSNSANRNDFTSVTTTIAKPVVRDPSCETVIDPNWVYAPEFIPSNNYQKMSYADVVSPPIGAYGDERKKQLCPYALKDGVCKYLPGECSYLHGDICEYCGVPALHPINEDLRKKHIEDCINQHERNMELSFAIARSKEKTCGICFEVIMEKGNGEQRFGILPNCNHCFCLACIRRWRRARQFENKIIRACPECRVTSDFVCPSIFWVDKKDDKTKLINDYKAALATKDCKYFGKGNGKCPFGNKCFYRHALSDGRICDVGPPTRQRRRCFLDYDIEVVNQVILWDFLDERNNPWAMIDDMDDIGDFFSDSEDSEWSDYEFFID